MPDYVMADEFKERVLAEFKRLRDDVKDISDKVDKVRATDISDLRVEIGMLKVKAGMIGAIAGAIPGLIGLLIQLLRH
jgi:hypothetical protein